MMKDWYLLYCKRSEQERAVINLDRQGAECYYPQVVVEKIVRGKRCECNEPLFPSYIFVTFDPEQLSFTTVRSTRGVADFIRQGALPQIVSEELIYNLMLNEDNNAYDHMFESLPQQTNLNSTKSEYINTRSLYAYQCDTSIIYACLC
jgi:transcriptional antiterminator RfaH